MFTRQKVVGFCIGVAFMAVVQISLASLGVKPLGFRTYVDGLMDTSSKAIARMIVCPEK